LLGHGDQEFAFAQDVAIRNVAVVVLLLLSPVAVAASFEEVARRQQHILAILHEVLALEGESMSDRHEVAQSALRPITDFLLQHRIQIARVQLVGTGEILLGVAIAASIPWKASSRIATIRFCSGRGGRGSSNRNTASMFARGIRAPVQVALICETVLSHKSQYRRNDRNNWQVGLIGKISVEQWPEKSGASTFLRYGRSRPYRTCSALNRNVELLTSRGSERPVNRPVWDSMSSSPT
jgi:hypothetical protein